MPFVINQGVRIHYQSEGAGPPLVLQHGYTQNLELWYLRGYVDALKAHYQLILIDARGHGASDKPHDRTAYVWPVMVVDVLAVLDDLKLTQAAFWGYSMGGAIVLGLAQHAPERVQALIVGGASAYARPLPSVVPDGSNPEEFISWVEVLIAARASPEYRTRLLSSDTRALAAAAQDRPSQEAGLSNMSMPALFYAGDKDPVFSNARATAEQIPQAVFVPLPGLDHPEAFMRTDLVVPHALGFLSGCQLQGRGKLGQTDVLHAVQRQ
jgi:pimeloyl-ACP methyl ester carboxylesterase